MSNRIVIPISVKTATAILDFVKVEGDLREMRDECIRRGMSRRQAMFGCTLVFDDAGLFLEGDTHDELAVCISYALPLATESL